MEQNRHKIINHLTELTYSMEKLCRAKEVRFSKDIGLTPIEFRCLRCLNNSRYQQAQDLAKYMEVSSPRITKLLNKLEEKQYITRESLKKDRRIANIKLSAKGKRFIEKINIQYLSFHEKIISKLKNEQIEDLVAGLETFKMLLSDFLYPSPQDNELI